MRFEIQGKRSDPDVAWSRLGDTDFLNRAANAGQVQMSLEPVEGGASRVVGSIAGPLGMPMKFVETRNGWVHQKWFRQERVYERSPIASTQFLLSFETDGDGVIPSIALDIEPSNMLLWPAVRASLANYRTSWQRVLDGLPAPGVTPPPAVVRELGPPTHAALDRWRKQASGPVVDAVRDLLLHDRDQSLRQLRPFGIADRFGLDRMETLVGMLRAVPAGLLEVYWSVRCPRCSGEVAATTTLSDIADHASCASCRQAFTTDLSESVEVVFAPHPSVAPRVAEKFCTFFPSGAPELVATLPVGGGQSLQELVNLPAGAVYRLGSGGGDADIELEVTPGGDRDVTFVVPASAGSGQPAGVRFKVAPGALQVAVANQTSADQRVIVARTSRGDDVVAASIVATLPEFRRELGTDVLSRNVRIGSRSVCLLFTDLSGSTAMYEEIGDAAAYALVRDHFEVVGAVIAAHGGVIVKTIGDAVMASFHTASDGVKAALAMRPAFDRFVEARGLATVPRLNVGVHIGPALAVHTDAAGMDWFGRTVNMAARAQSAARDGALVLTDAVWTDALVPPLVAPFAALTDRIEADLKGIGRTGLWRIRRDGTAR